jgi:hypothetical protein
MPSRGYRKRVSDAKVALPCTVRTRLPTAIHEKLTTEADEREVTVARYLRAVVEAHLSQQRTKLPQARAHHHALLRQLARVGNNLNQLTRQAHAGIVPVKPEEVQTCLANLNEIARKI